jgi:hypothetical protein
VPARGLVFALCLLLQACVYVPVAVDTYDYTCRTVARQYTLQPVQVAALQGCANSGCAVMLAAAGITAAGSLVVSGSIAIIGNVVYWLEKQGRCLTPQSRASSAAYS